MRTPSAACRNGHKWTDTNTLWHTRYDKQTREKRLVRECRACANKRYRNKRQAIKRNVELEQVAAVVVANEFISQLPI